MFAVLATPIQPARPAAVLNVLLLCTLCNAVAHKSSFRSLQPQLSQQDALDPVSPRTAWPMNQLADTSQSEDRTATSPLEDFTPRFQALDSVSAGLYADISKRLDTQITEAPRAILQRSSDSSKPPVIVFSDTCIVDGTAQPAEGGGVPVENNPQPDGADNPPKSPCKAASSITIEQLRKALATRTEGAKGTFMCEYKASSKFVHCVLQPDHTGVKEETMTLRTVLEEANARSKRVSGPEAMLRVPASELGGKIRKEIGHKGPCRLALDGSGKHVIPTLQLALGDQSRMTVYTSCPNSGPASGLFAGGALVASDDIDMLREAAKRLMTKYHKATCHCRLSATAPDSSAQAVADIKLSKQDMQPSGAPATADPGPFLQCQCVELSTASPAAANPLITSVEGRVAATRKALFSYWERLHAWGSNATYARAITDKNLDVLRTHDLAGPVVGAGIKGISSGGMVVDTAALDTSQTFDPFALLADTQSSKDSKPHGIWADVRNSASTNMFTSIADKTPAVDLFYIRLAYSAMQRLTPAHTSTAAAELAALTTMLKQYISLCDQVAVLNPDVTGDNHERIRRAPVPFVVEEHLHQLERDQARMRRDISLSTARIDGIPNTDPAKVVKAMRALATGAPDGVQLVRKLRASLGGNPSKPAGASWASETLSAMYVTQQSASMCMLWPRCASLIGGTALQRWLLLRIGTEAAGSLPLDSGCADGGIGASASTALSLVNSSASTAARTLNDAVQTVNDPELATAMHAGKQDAASVNAKHVLQQEQRTYTLKGRVQLLQLRAWCDSAAAERVMVDVTRMVYNLLQPAATSPSPSASPTPTVAASPSPAALTLSVRELAGDEGLHAAAVVQVSKTRVKPVLAELEKTFLQLSSSDNPSIDRTAPASVNYTQMLSAIAANSDAQSLMLRLNGTLACLCLFSGVPSFSAQIESLPKFNLVPTWRSVIRNFSSSVDDLRSELASTQPNSTSVGVPADPPFSSSSLFAHIARDLVELPPSNDIQLAAFVEARLQQLKSETLAKQRLVQANLATTRNLHGSDAEGELKKLEGEKSQVEAERARLAGLIKSRLATILKDLQERLKKLNITAYQATSALQTTLTVSHAAVATAKSSRDADLEYLRQLQTMLAELRALAEAAKLADTRTVWVAGCQGGGGDAGAAIAHTQAVALQRLAAAQTNLQHAAEEALVPSLSESARKSAVKNIESIQQSIDNEYASFLAVSLQFEMATCSCVQRVAGIPCTYGIINANNTPHGLSSPINLAASGNITGALASAADARAKLAAANAALEGERQRWEEAVVRLVRPKSCLQLQALATGGRSGMYTVFPPDDFQYRGIKVYCDMSTENGGWTLVATAPKGGLAGPMSVTNGDSTTVDRATAGNVNAVWIAQASSEMAIAWTSASASAPTGGISSYGAAIAVSLPSLAPINLATMPPPPLQSCNSENGDFTAVSVRCIPVGSNATAVACQFPPRMYTGTTSMGTCMGHAYGVVLRATTSVCDGFLPFGTNTTQSLTAGDVFAQSGVFVSTDGAPGCAGVLPMPTASSAPLGFVPAHMSIWFR
jgi:hypothetical protein